MDDDDLVALAEELVARPFPDGSAHGSDWLVGLAQSGPEAHFAPIAKSDNLYYMSADYDERIAELWEEIYHDFERQRQQATSALTTLWGAPQPYSFAAEQARVWANDESVSELDYDLAMFTSGKQFQAWRQGERIVGLLLGQMDKEFPIVLTLAVIARAPS